MLRALQEGKITRVGGKKDIKVDVRVLAATNKNLLEEVEAKRFRLDLYHRLSVINIHVPSLNDRVDDIPELTLHFLNTIAKSYGSKAKSITKEAVELLKEKYWSGNIRELRNIVERLIILSEESEITLDDVKEYVRFPSH